VCSLAGEEWVKGGRKEWGRDEAVDRTEAGAAVGEGASPRIMGFGLAAMARTLLEPLLLEVGEGARAVAV
jgi:hypothetical protein